MFFMSAVSNDDLDTGFYQIEARVFYDVIESERGELPNEDVTVDS